MRNDRYAVLKVKIQKLTSIFSYRNKHTSIDSIFCRISSLLWHVLCFLYHFPLSMFQYNLSPLIACKLFGERLGSYICKILINPYPTFRSVSHPGDASLLLVHKEATVVANCSKEILYKAKA